MEQARSAHPSEAVHGNVPDSSEHVHVHGTPVAPAGARLDAERLDVYRLAVEFQVLASRLVPKRGQPTLRDQLDRASVSIVLNIAEGAGRVSGPDKAHFYAMARGSTMECAAVLGLLLARGLADAATCRRARSLLVRLVQMLTKLNARFSAGSSLTLPSATERGTPS